MLFVSQSKGGGVVEKHRKYIRNAYKIAKIAKYVVYVAKSLIDLFS